MHPKFTLSFGLFKLQQPSDVIYIKKKKKYPLIRRSNKETRIKAHLNLNQSEEKKQNNDLSSPVAPPPPPDNKMSVRCNDNGDSGRKIRIRAVEGAVRRLNKWLNIRQRFREGKGSTLFSRNVDPQQQRQSQQRSVFLRVRARSSKKIQVKI